MSSENFSEELHGDKTTTSSTLLCTLNQRVRNSPPLPSPPLPSPPLPSPPLPSPPLPSPPLPSPPLPSPPLPSPPLPSPPLPSPPLPSPPLPSPPLPSPPLPSPPLPSPPLPSPPLPSPPLNSSSFQIVCISGNDVATGEGFPHRKHVNILFEETYFNHDDLSYPLICISEPLHLPSTSGMARGIICF